MILLNTAWLMGPSIYKRLHNLLADAMPFRWGERARRRGYWRRRALPAALIIAGVVIAVLVGNVGISVAKQVTHAFASVSGPSTSAATPGSLVISPLNNTATTPTPAADAYTVGVWTSDTMPAGGSVTAYVRVSQGGSPVAKTPVYLFVSIGGPGGGYRLGPLMTDAYGMAMTKVNASGSGSGTPIFLTATTTIAGQSYSGDYTFYAM